MTKGGGGRGKLEKEEWRKERAFSVRLAALLRSLYSTTTGCLSKTCTVDQSHMANPGFLEDTCSSDLAYLSRSQVISLSDSYFFFSIL